jgi:hypothetical protein
MVLLYHNNAKQCQSKASILDSCCITHYCLWQIKEMILYTKLNIWRHDCSGELSVTLRVCYSFQSKLKICSMRPWTYNGLWRMLTQSLTYECFIVTSTLGINLSNNVRLYTSLCQILLELQVNCGLSHLLDYIIERQQKLLLIQQKSIYSTSCNLLFFDLTARDKLMQVIIHVDRHYESLLLLYSTCR